MSEPRKLKPISEVLRSARFQREISLLLFFFAAVSGIYSVLMFAASKTDETALALAVGYLVETLLYVGLAILIRRGSVKALVVTGVLVVANILLTLFGPSWEDARAMLIAHGLLLLVLIRYVNRERRTVTEER
jgi:hypothetical protein